MKRLFDSEKRIASTFSLIDSLALSTSENKPREVIEPTPAKKFTKEEMRKIKEVNDKVESLLDDQPQMTKIFVLGIDERTDVYRIEQHFSKFGKVR